MSRRQQRRRPATRPRPSAKPTSGPYTVSYDFGDTLRMASKKPDEQLAEVLRFLAADIDATNARAWSGALKGLALRPLASESGRLRIQWQIVGSYDPLDVATLKRLQANLRAGVRALVAPAPGDAWQGVWPLPRPEGLFMLRDQSSAYVWQYSHKDAQRSDEGSGSMILLAVAQLVAEHADRVRACKWCKVIFLAVKRQEFCTPNHAQRARNEKKATRRKGGK
jgi:hypothetical protein